VKALGKGTKIMMNKKIVVRAFLVVEIVFFVILYVVSPEGISSLHTKQRENKLLAHSVERLAKEIEKLKDETQKWEQNPFYQEKIAREHLQMARPTDEVYFL
jgi:cell division protein FtsB